MNDHGAFHVCKLKRLAICCIPNTFSHYPLAVSATTSVLNESGDDGVAKPTVLNEQEPNRLPEPVHGMRAGDADLVPEEEGGANAGKLAASIDAGVGAGAGANNEGSGSAARLQAGVVPPPGGSFTGEEGGEGGVEKSPFKPKVGDRLEFRGEK
eukprot:1427400-Pleurochrysis_carterae.AAC.1